MQRSQHLMISFATYLCGMRIRVYRAEGTTQWYTAVSTGYNANTQVNNTVQVPANQLKRPFYNIPNLPNFKGPFKMSIN